MITSEDVGLAELTMPATIHALYSIWRDLRKGDGDGGQLFLVHAVLLLARAKKSRIVDHALIALYNEDDRREIPDVALDKHSSPASGAAAARRTSSTRRRC